MANWNRIAAALKLSPQQKRIAELLLRNCRDQQIADELQLKVPTVRTHLRRMFERLKVRDRMELVLMIFADSHQPIERDPE